MFYQRGLGRGGVGSLILAEKGHLLSLSMWLVPEKGLLISGERGPQGTSTLPQSKHKVHNKCEALESSRFMKMLSSMKPVSGTKNRLGNAAVGDVLSKTSAVNPHPINK